MFKKVDYISIIMTAIGLYLVITGNFMMSMESRISKYKGIPTIEALGPYFWCIVGALSILLVLCVIKSDNKNLNFFTGIWNGFCIGLTLLLSGLSPNFIEATSDNFRVTWGFVFYFLMLVFFSVNTKCNENIDKGWKRFITSTLGIIMIVFIVVSGGINKLSFMIEYFSRQKLFAIEFMKHLKLSLGVVISGVLVGIPMGYLTYRNQRLERIVSFILNISQSMPSIARMLALVIFFSFLSREFPILKDLGITGFGAAPVFVALFLYSQFQIVNSVRAAFRTIEGEYMEVAKSLGMSKVKIFTNILLPMALPVIMSCIRITTIYTFSDATLGARLGFGGLGLIISRGGSNGVALDLILLGTIPILIMIFACDFLLTWVVKSIEDKTKIIITTRS